MIALQLVERLYGSSRLLLVSVAAPEGRGGGVVGELWSLSARWRSTEAVLLAFRDYHYKEICSDGVIVPLMTTILVQVTMKLHLRFGKQALAYFDPGFFPVAMFISVVQGGGYLEQLARGVITPLV